MRTWVEGLISLSICRILFTIIIIFITINLGYFIYHTNSLNWGLSAQMVDIRDNNFNLEKSVRIGHNWGDHLSSDFFRSLKYLFIFVYILYAPQKSHFPFILFVNKMIGLNILFVLLLARCYNLFHLNEYLKWVFQKDWHSKLIW